MSEIGFPFNGNVFGEFWIPFSWQMLSLLDHRQNFQMTLNKNGGQFLWSKLFPGFSKIILLDSVYYNNLYVKYATSWTEIYLSFFEINACQFWNAQSITIRASKWEMKNK